MPKIVLVSGGNRGIGHETCRQLAAIGNQVILGARDLRKAEEAVNQLQGQLTPLQLDVTDRQSVADAAAFIESEFGHLDVLINNAAIMGPSDGGRQVPIEKIQHVFETNFYGVIRLTQALLPLLTKSDDGRIINLSSGMGAISEMGPGHTAYRLSKTALNGYTINLALDLAETGIRVNAMCPGWVRTDMGGPSAPRPVGKGAETAVWLASEEVIPNGRFLRDKKIIQW